VSSGKIQAGIGLLDTVGELEFRRAGDLGARLCG
jgi:hypothetical protein